MKLRCSSLDGKEIRILNDVLKLNEETTDLKITYRVNGIIYTWYTMGNYTVEEIK